MMMMMMMMVVIGVSKYTVHFNETYLTSVLNIVLVSLDFVVLPKVGDTYSGTYTFFTCVTTEGTTLTTKFTVAAVTKSSDQSYVKVCV